MRKLIFRLYTVDSPENLIDMGVTINLSKLDEDSVLTALEPYVHVIDPYVYFDYGSNGIKNISIMECDVLAYFLVLME